MRIRNLFVPLALTVIYWSLSSLVLIDIIVDDGLLFPDWMDEFLMPGYMIGFGLGYSGGNSLAFIGQIISLVLIGIISIGIFELLKLLVNGVGKIIK